jgi:hypothetical protein
MMNDNIDRILTGATPERYVYEAARVELAALRATVKALSPIANEAKGLLAMLDGVESNEPSLTSKVIALQRTITAQATQLNQAREAMLESEQACGHGKEFDCDACDCLDAWLAANPA